MTFIIWTAREKRIPSFTQAGFINRGKSGAGILPILGRCGSESYWIWHVGRNT